MITDVLYKNDSLNVLVFHAINNIQEPWFQQLAAVGAAVGKYTMFPLYLALTLLFAWAHCKQLKTSMNYEVHRQEMKQVIIALIISYGVYLLWVSGLKHFLHMPRPFVVLPDSMFIKESVKSAEAPWVSIPSGHASFAMMMLVSLWPLLNKPGKTIGIFLVLWISISRIALGVHFPFDIAISLCISYAITYLTNYFIRQFWFARK